MLGELRKNKAVPGVPILPAGLLPVALIAYPIGDATRSVGNSPQTLMHVCNDIGAWGREFVVAVSRRWPGTVGLRLS